MAQNQYADGPSGSDKAKSFWDDLWGGWNGMWGDFSENEKKRTEQNMSNYHARPDYQRNVAERNATHTPAQQGNGRTVGQMQKVPTKAVGRMER